MLDILLVTAGISWWFVSWEKAKKRKVLGRKCYALVEQSAMYSEWEKTVYFFTELQTRPLYPPPLYAFIESPPPHNFRHRVSLMQLLNPKVFKMTSIYFRIKKIFFKDFCLSNYYVTNDYFWWCWYFLNIPFWCTLVLSVRIREGGETAW